MQAEARPCHIRIESEVCARLRSRAAAEGRDQREQASPLRPVSAPEAEFSRWYEYPPDTSRDFSAQTLPRAGAAERLGDGRRSNHDNGGLRGVGRAALRRKN